ncbi:MAG: hypothetical protein J7639_18930 [Paenibacillaceae bacterium]|nr:hypothetical protein [Paenibacillaceae bacterium]
MNEYRETSVVDHEEVQQKKFSHQDGRFLRPIDTARLVSTLMWHEFELSRMAFGWMPAIPDFAVKGKLGRAGYVHNQHAKLLYERLTELPGSIGEKDGSPAVIRELFERIASAPSPAAFYRGYLFAVQRMYAEYDALSRRLDPILDAPTCDKLKFIAVERGALQDWLHPLVQFAGSDDAASTAELQMWHRYVEVVWGLSAEAIAGGKKLEEVRYPVHPTDSPAGPVPVESLNDPHFPPSTPNPKYKKAYTDPDLSPLGGSIKQMHYINATEIGAAESLCYLYYGVRRMPLAFYFDLARHLWDEVRHSQMGVRRLEQMGYRTDQFKFFKGSPGQRIDELKKEWFPDMYAGLTMVAEPCSFIKKRKSAENFWKFGDALSAIQSEFDMVDERMHVDFGKKWGPELYKQIDDIITAQEMSERMRVRRLEGMGELPQEEIAKVVKNFPGFCGLSTVELEYTHY